MNDKTLKMLAINSFCFLLVLCLLSGLLSYNSHVFANTDSDMDITDGSGITDGTGELPVNTVNEEIISEAGNDALLSFDADKLGNTYIRLDISKISYEQITLQDNYMEQMLCLQISGLDEQSFHKKDVERIHKKEFRYGKASAGDSGDLIEDLQISYTYNPSDFTYQADISLQMKKLYAPKLMLGTTYCYIVLQQPKDVYDKIVVIDAGHGGADTGTYSRDLSCIEPTYTLAIAMELKKLLDESSIKAYYTRLADTDVSKKARVQLANRLDADFLISIHCNGAQGIDLTANGMEALYTDDKDIFTVSSRSLASACLTEMVDSTGRKDRGIIYRSDLYLLNHAKVPTTILEVGFMSNTQDMKYLNKKRNLSQIAEGIFNGIQKSYEKLETEGGL